MSNLNLVHTSTDELPSQEGQKGRPRKNGRVSVLGTGLDRKVVQATLAEQFGVQPAQVAPYSRESDEFRLTFVVPGVPVNERRVFSAES